MGILSWLGKQVKLAFPIVPGAILRNLKNGETGVVLDLKHVIFKSQVDRRLVCQTFEDFCAPYMRKCSYLANIEGFAIPLPTNILQELRNKISYLDDELLGYYEVNAFLDGYFRVQSENPNNESLRNIRSFNDYMSYVQQKYQARFKEWGN